TTAAGAAERGGACLPAVKPLHSRESLHADSPHSASSIDPTKELILLAIIHAAGWPIYFLLLASVIALALIVERLLYLRRARILPPTLLQEVIRVYQNGRIDDKVVTTLEQNSPLGRVLAAGLRNVDAPREIMNE